MSVSLSPLPFAKEPLPANALLDSATFAHGALETITVTRSMIDAAPRSADGGYYSGATPLSLALRAALGGRWKENETGDGDEYGYADIASQWTVATPTARMRFAHFSADAYEFMALWYHGGANAVSPGVFQVRITTMSAMPKMVRRPR